MPDYAYYLRDKWLNRYIRQEVSDSHPVDLFLGLDLEYQLMIIHNFETGKMSGAVIKPTTLDLLNK